MGKGIANHRCITESLTAVVHHFPMNESYRSNIIYELSTAKTIMVF
jgi:hypothetical protein